MLFSVSVIKSLKLKKSKFYRGDQSKCKRSPHRYHLYLGQYHSLMVVRNNLCCFEYVKTISAFEIINDFR